MDITDELREWAHGFTGPYKRNEQQLLAIADRIDAEHEAKVTYWQGASYKDGYDEGFASADDWCGQHEDAMAEHGWVRMPEDADGEYWFCGDKIMLPDGNVVKIIGIGGDWLYYCVASVAITVFGRIRAHDKHHYKQPTVEGTLREFARECLTYSTCVDDHEVTDAIELYAPKLRLAGDAE